MSGNGAVGSDPTSASGFGSVHMLMAPPGSVGESGAMRQRNHRGAGHYIPAPLVVRPCRQTHNVISIGIDLFGLHAAAKTDHVGQVHMRAVLGRGGFEEPGVSDPICDRVDLPARALDPDVVGRLRALEPRGVVVVVHRIDGLERVRPWIPPLLASKNPACPRISAPQRRPGLSNHEPAKITTVFGGLQQIVTRKRRHQLAHSDASESPPLPSRGRIGDHAVGPNFLVWG